MSLIIIIIMLPMFFLSLTHTHTFCNIFYVWKGCNEKYLPPPFSNETYSCHFLLWRKLKMTTRDYLSVCLKMLRWVSTVGFVLNQKSVCTICFSSPNSMARSVYIEKPIINTIIFFFAYYLLSSIWFFWIEI